MEAWKTHWNIHETRRLSNILLVCCKSFTCKIQEDDDLLDHINKMKALMDRLAYLEIHVRNKNIVLTLLESMSHFYEHLITILEIMPKNELTVYYMMAHLMHKMSKKEEKEP